MKDFLMSLDWNLLLGTIWTVIGVPCLTIVKNKITEYCNAHISQKYTDLLHIAAETTVKDLQDSLVKEIKGTEEWTPERIAQISEVAIDKTIEGIPDAAYQFLKEHNGDLEAYINSAIQAKLYELKQQEK